MLIVHRELAKLLVECKQDIPECLEQFKPEIQDDAPLFDDDDDDDEEDDANANAKADGPVPAVSQGAAWDAGDTSVVFQGDSLRTFSLLPSLFFNLLTCGSWGWRLGVISICGMLVKRTVNAV
jgi:hypothetical protein